MADDEVDESDISDFEVRSTGKIVCWLSAKKKKKKVGKVSIHTERQINALVYSKLRRLEFGE